MPSKQIEISSSFPIPATRCAYSDEGGEKTHRIAEDRDVPVAEARELGVHDVDGPAARLRGHAAEERGDVGAPALEVLLDLARRRLADPRRAGREAGGPDGDVVSGDRGRDVDLPR